MRGFGWARSIPKSTWIVSAGALVVIATMVVWHYGWPAVSTATQSQEKQQQEPGDQKQKEQRQEESSGQKEEEQQEPADQSKNGNRKENKEKRQQPPQGDLPGSGRVVIQNYDGGVVNVGKHPSSSEGDDDSTSHTSKEDDASTQDSVAEDSSFSLKPPEDPEPVSRSQINRAKEKSGDGYLSFFSQKALSGEGEFIFASDVIAGSLGRNRDGEWSAIQDDGSENGNRVSFPDYPFKSLPYGRSECPTIRVNGQRVPISRIFVRLVTAQGVGRTRCGSSGMTPH